MIELLEDAMLTCVATALVNFNMYPGKTKQVFFNVGGASAIGTVSLTNLDLAIGVTVGTNALPTAPLPTL